MQYRQLPPANDLAAVEAVWRAVPRDPAETDDCCARLTDRTAVETREHASEWLVFLTALGCVTDDDGRYYRREDDLDIEALGDQFESRVLGVPAVLETLESAEEPLTRDDIEDQLDTGTRRRLERTRDAYLDRLLAWGVTFGRIDATDEGYTLLR